MNAPNSIDWQDAMTQTGAVHGGISAYTSKDDSYFSGARYDYVEALPVNPDARILEVGCSNGGTGALALSRRKCGSYYGVELSPIAADAARKKLTSVLEGNIEEIGLPWGPETFDALILSEVLEHLVDPWATLQKLRRAMKPGALVFASSPNVSQYRVVRMLVQGDWDLANSGVMDRTHLRWFTPKTYRGLFTSSGYVVDSVREIVPLGRMARLVNGLTMGRFKHLFIRQMNLRAHCS